MKKFIKKLMLFMVLFLSISVMVRCTKTTEQPDLNLKEIFDSLPNFDFIPQKIDGQIITSFSGQGYQGNIIPTDTADYELLGDMYLKLDHEGREILNEEYFWGQIRYKGDIVMVIYAFPGVPHGSMVYYKGIDLTEKLRPKNFPAINNVRLSDGKLFLEYYSRVNAWYTPNIPASYGRYNLISGDLILEGSGLPE